MGDVGSARYEPALLPPCLTMWISSYTNCQRSTHSISKWLFRNLALWGLSSFIIVTSKHIFMTVTYKYSKAQPTLLISHLCEKWHIFNLIYMTYNPLFCQISSWFLQTKYHILNIMERLYPSGQKTQHKKWMRQKEKLHLSDQISLDNCGHNAQDWLSSLYWRFLTRCMGFVCL